MTRLIIRRISVGLLGGSALSLLLAANADAYVGPGSGLAALASLLTLAGAVVLAVFGFVWFPIKRLLKRKTK